MYVPCQKLRNLQESPEAPEVTETQEAPEDPLHRFLREAKLDSYWNAMMEKGYDDYEHFTTNASEEEVLNMANTVGMKPGHRDRFLSRWRITKHIDTPAPSTSTLIHDTPMPKRISKLLLPYPSEDKQSFFNMVVKDIYRNNHSLMTVPSLETYIINQRELRYKLLARNRVVEKVVADCVDDEKPIEGSYLPIRWLLKASSLTKSNYGQAKKAVVFLQDKRSKFVTPLLKDLRELKGALIRENDVLDWKANELSYYSHMLKDVLKLEGVILSHISEIERLLACSRVDVSYAKEAQQTKDAQNRKRNQYKDKEAKIKRNYKSAELVLKIICETHGKKYGTLVNAGDFSFQVTRSDISFQKFDKLLPWTHLNGLTLLLEKEVFMDCYDSVDQERQLLIRKKDEGAQKRVARKTKLKQKSAAEDRQRKISFTVLS